MIDTTHRLDKFNKEHFLQLNYSSVIPIYSICAAATSFCQCGDKVKQNEKSNAINHQHVKNSSTMTRTV